MPNIKKFMWLQARNVYNPTIRLLRRKPIHITGFRELDEVSRRALENTDISDHLVTLFLETLASRPQLIVELGVRGGESTFVLERAAKISKAKIVSVDIEPMLWTPSYPGWEFVQQDDIKLANEFRQFCEKRSMPSEIDLLFIDTSHLYEHTVQEINAWFPFVSSRGKVIFHDTNMQPVYFRKDGTMRFGWDNHRGVIAAIEQYLGKRFDETKDFIDFSNGWLIRHFAHSNGLSILQRLEV